MPIINALGALGKNEALRQPASSGESRSSRAHLRRCRRTPARAILLANDYAQVGRVEDAKREVTLAMALRPNEATVLYNAACAFCLLRQKARGAGRAEEGLGRRLQGRDWARRDPDLEVLHGDPEFERLYPATE